MTGHRKTGKITVDGMTCSHCEQRIETALGALAGVIKVYASAPLDEVSVSYDSDKVSFEAIADAIRGAGYQVRGDGADRGPRTSPREAAQRAKAEPAPEDAAAGVKTSLAHAIAASKAAPAYRFLGLIAVIVALYIVLRYVLRGYTFLPAANQSIGCGLLLLVGLLTSLHCLAMCGGIVLSQGISFREGQPQSNRGKRQVPGLLYNAGRVVSYTVIGGVVGALGSLFSISTTLKGVMPIIARAFMLFLGVRMLGIVPWLSRLRVRFPGVGEQRISAAAAGRGPPVIGLLNGLMPCGPLQTMQVYALGTGSWLPGLSPCSFSAWAPCPSCSGSGRSAPS